MPQLTREALRAAYEERRDALGWMKTSGKPGLTKKGEDEALSYLIGIAKGLALAGHDDAAWVGQLAWLSSVRTVESVL